MIPLKLQVPEFSFSGESSCLNGISLQSLAINIAGREKLLRLIEVLLKLKRCTQKLKCLDISREVTKETASAL